MNQQINESTSRCHVIAYDIGETNSMKYGKPLQGWENFSSVLLTDK